MRGALDCRRRREEGARARRSPVQAHVALPEGSEVQLERDSGEGVSNLALLSLVAAIVA